MYVIRTRRDKFYLIPEQHPLRGVRVVLVTRLRCKIARHAFVAAYEIHYYTHALTRIRELPAVMIPSKPFAAYD